ncbi:response regulator [Methanobacterium oryzae]|uniref:response regulator n=1 Tax=Methanobacterium oryzae TaxID=69540 RepID=UPI003D2134BD
MTKAKILIVEDEGLTAFALQRKLRKWGYEVPTFTVSGKDAVQKVDKIQPDLVLLDINLKGELDGLEAAEEIIKHQDIPIIFTTAYDDEQMSNRAHRIGASGYITKPYEEKELKENIENILHEKIENYESSGLTKNESDIQLLESIHISKVSDAVVEENYVETETNEVSEKTEILKNDIIEKEHLSTLETTDEKVNHESNEDISKKMDDVLDVIYKRHNIIESHLIQADGQVLYSNISNSSIQHNVISETLRLIESSRKLSEIGDNKLERIFFIGDKMQTLITLSSDLALIFSLEPNENIGMVSLVMKNAFNEINGILNN